MKRAYYSAAISEFLGQSVDEILGTLRSNDTSASTTKLQGDAWRMEIEILKDQLCKFSDGRILFEYSIPRMGKRVDVVLLHRNTVFIIEFKCGGKEYRSSAYDQVYDYALDLRNFQKESHDKLLVPIMVETEAEAHSNEYRERDHIIQPLRCNKSNIANVINEVTEQFSISEKDFDYLTWENSVYKPTPTIIEAAQALYANHNVDEITRHEADAHNLSSTMEAIREIIKDSKANNKKSICFVTGVPGAGKTLVGLNIAIEYSRDYEQGNAAFLSGNYSLVRVLQEALARDSVEQSRKLNDGDNKILPKKKALRETSSFIQIIHTFRDDLLDKKKVPHEHIVVFDEAQRAWRVEQISKFMATKKNEPGFSFSEPEFLISTMDRHSDWAVIICLIGGGQEINTGEAGLGEWFDSLRRSFPDWEVYVTPQINDSEYLRERNWHDMIQGLRVNERDELHLSTSIRSFRSSELAKFVKALLDIEISEAKRLYSKLKDKYPIVVTRDLKKAKSWILDHCPGTTRCGLLASSGALRLKPEGIFVNNRIDVAHWFLNGKEDVRSCYSLEDVVTEFDIQGLEIDFSIVAWDADFRYENNAWKYCHFKGAKWEQVNKDERKLYMKNAYRVLLTRARQGMAIFVPSGNSDDPTRCPVWYDRIYSYLKEIGIDEL